MGSVKHLMMEEYENMIEWKLEMGLESSKDYK